MCDGIHIVTLWTFCEIVGGGLNVATKNTGIQVVKLQISA